MEIKHPTTNAINKQNLKEAFYLLGKCESGIVMPFEQIQRGGNETFDNFMNKADSLRFSHKTLEKEAELFNKELMKNQKLLFLSNKLNTIPDSPKAIKEFEDISSNILGIAKNVVQ